MSPASRSKSKDKRAGKEPQKASSKQLAPSSTGSGTPTSGYNPHLGTFHTLETVSLSSASTLHGNGRFQNIDDTDENSGVLPGTGFEYDAISNNDSWSGESEDHKEKTSNPTGKQGAIPGADNDKREKIRMKNERKHQRQKEKRAQELHERCNGYLMSRKLEVLAQQLVNMGFSSDRATMALILNEGKVEESVAWLFDGSEEADKHKGQNLDGGSNLKIDITEELAKMAEMEIKYYCSKQDVERAVVAGEGDLEKAAEALRAQRHDPPAAAPKPEATGDPPNMMNNGGRPSVAVTPNLLLRAAQSKPNSSSSIPTRRREEKDFNYTKTASMETGSKNVQPVKRIQPKLDWAKQQQIAKPADKRWPGAGAGSNPSVSHSLSSSAHVSAPPPPPNAETRYVAVGNEPKILQPGSLREPVIVMQRPQSTINSKQVPAATSINSSSGTTAGWYPNNVEVMKSNGLLSNSISTRSLSPNNISANQLYHHHHLHQHQHQHQHHHHHQPQLVSSSSPVVHQGNDSWSRMSTSPTLSAASSLGLFSWLGSSNLASSSSSVDWSSSGSINQFDYTSIDWSLDRNLPLSTKSSGLWQGLSYLNNPTTPMYDSSISEMGAKPTMGSTQPSNGNMVSNALLKDGGIASAEASAAGSREWTSPFEGNDLFSLPRQFVSSPSM